MEILQLRTMFMIRRSTVRLITGVVVSSQTAMIVRKRGGQYLAAGLQEGE